MYQQYKTSNCVNDHTNQRVLTSFEIAAPNRKYNNSHRYSPGLTKKFNKQETIYTEQKKNILDNEKYV